MLLQELPAPSSSSEDSLFLLAPSRAQSAELPVTSPVVAQAQRALKQVWPLPCAFVTRSADRRLALSVVLYYQIGNTERQERLLALLLGPLARCAAGLAP